MAPALRDRFTGCLLGLAVGDALGAPVEFMTRAALQGHVGQVRDMLGGGWLDLKPGQVTDETEMMVCVAESLVTREALDVADLAHRLLTWYRHGPRDVGLGTAKALEQLAAGASPDQAAQRARRQMPAHKADNGALVRSAPLGMLLYFDAERLIAETVVSSRLTHDDPRSTYAAASLNLVVAGCLRGLPVTQALKEAREAMRRHQDEVAQAIDAALAQPYERPEVSGLALDTLRAACRCFFATSTFEEALIQAVNLGGDTDTVGAACGAMAGAYYGKGSIPRRWLAVLEHRDYVEALALALYGISGADAEELRQPPV